MIEELKKAQEEKYSKMSNDELHGIQAADEEKRIVCALFGCSKIQKTCFGYYYCGRCGNQLGDQLGSVYDATKVVIISHKCETCIKNYEACTRTDKLMVKPPFEE